MCRELKRCGLCGLGYGVVRYNGRVSGGMRA